MVPMRRVARGDDHGSREGHPAVRGRSVGAGGRKAHVLTQAFILATAHHTGDETALSFGDAAGAARATRRRRRRVRRHAAARKRENDGRERKANGQTTKKAGPGGRNTREHKPEGQKAGEPGRRPKAGRQEDANLCWGPDTGEMFWGSVEKRKRSQSRRNDGLI